MTYQKQLQNELVTKHVTSCNTLTSRSADSEILAVASSLIRAIVSAAPAAASAAARRAWKHTSSM